MLLELNPTAHRDRARRPNHSWTGAQANPMFSDQKMKLGLFGTNCSHGLTMSHAPTTYKITWEHQGDRPGESVPTRDSAIEHVVWWFMPAAGAPDRRPGGAALDACPHEQRDQD